MTKEEAVERYGIDIIEQLERCKPEPTGRVFDPETEPEYAGLDEYLAGGIPVEGGELYAYYYQPEDVKMWVIATKEGERRLGVIDSVEVI